MELEELAEPAAERMAESLRECAPGYWADEEAAVPAWVDAYEV